MVEVGRQLVLVVSHTGTVFNNPSNSTLTKVAEVVLVDMTGDKASKTSNILLVAINGHIKVCHDLKELTELLVIGIEHLIGIGIADDNNLHVQRNRLGLEGCGNHGPSHGT